MTDHLRLAELHRAAQVKAAAGAQVSLSTVMDRTLDPTHLDASTDAYLRAALAVVVGGRRNAAALATSYYGAAKEAVGLEALVPRLGDPRVDVASVTTSLLVTGPVAVKKALSSGAGLQAAMDGAKAKTLRAGKRHVLNGGREHLMNVMRADKDARGWARVSDGAACAFCAMLISRGPVYTKSTGAFKSHDGCGCGVRPYFGTEAEGDGFSPDARALRNLWDRGATVEGRKVAMDLSAFRTKYAEALLDEDSPVLQTISDKVATRVSVSLVKEARRLAEEAAEAAVVVEKAPAIPAFAAKVQEIAKGLPEDRAEIGHRNVVMSADDRIAESMKHLEETAGGSIDHFEDLLRKAEAQVATWERLALAMDDVPGISRMTKWPPELADLAKEAGFSRRQPKTVARGIWGWKSLQDTEVAKIRMKRDQLVSQRQYLRNLYDGPDEVTRRVDLDEVTGEIGDVTKAHLAAVKEAGQIADEEISRRLADLGHPSPADWQARLAAAKAERDRLRAETEGPARGATIQERMAYRDAAWDRFQEADRAYSHLLRDARKAMDGYRRAYAVTAKEVLAEIRPLHTGPGTVWDVTDGGPIGAQKLREIMQEAEGKYPAEWVARFREKFPEVDLAHVRRGYWRASEAKLRLSGDEDYLPRVAVHELGHGMESSVPGLRALEWAFHYSRTSSVGPSGARRREDLTELYAGSGEMSYKDEFLQPYTGKVYRQSGALETEQYWEIFQTGVESTLAHSPYIVGEDGRTDDDLRRFILGVLSVL